MMCCDRREGRGDVRDEEVGYDAISEAILEIARHAPCTAGKRRPAGAEEDDGPIIAQNWEQEGMQPQLRWTPDLANAVM